MISMCRASRRGVLGRYWRTASPEEQQEFLRLFQEYIVQAYAARLGEYGGEPFRVLGSRRPAMRPS
jgi:phospholipid transport system substrate-binding protein